jgi:endonuclease/exonuclease/phosphatase family metal-dependent hydrolase
MLLKIASWNIEGRLSNIGLQPQRGSSSQIIQQIKSINADLLILLEAHSELTLDDLKSHHQLTSMGYKIYNVPYGDDTPKRQDAAVPRLSMMFLSKLPVKKFDIIKLGNFRNAFMAQVGSDKLIQVVGLHLDDRSENTRLQQIGDLIKIIGQPKLPTIVSGDFNAMHGEDRWPAHFLRNPIVQAITHIVLPNLAERATEMARGETIKLLESKTGLVDADKSHRPTTTPKMRGQEWLPSIRLIQIDHMFISKDITVKHFQVMPDGGADHRAIVADYLIQ